MGFQRARTEEQIADRRSEILKACDSLYRVKGYDGVNLKAISEMTSITRPAIYNYYATKEEIFLDLLTCDYLGWKKDLEQLSDTEEPMAREEYCRFLTESLKQHQRMLDLISIHLPAIENNSRMERLVEFKKTVVSVFQTFALGVRKHFPDRPEQVGMEFLRHFFAYIYGLYQFTHHSAKQIEAMRLAGIPESNVQFEEQCYNGLILLTTNLCGVDRIVTK